MFSAAASLGVSLLWDTDVGLSQVDRYACADEDHLKVCSLGLSFRFEGTNLAPSGWSYAGQWIDSLGH